MTLCKVLFVALGKPMEKPNTSTMEARRKDYFGNSRDHAHQNKTKKLTHSTTGAPCYNSPVQLDLRVGTAYAGRGSHPISRLQNDIMKHKYDQLGSGLRDP